MHLEASIPSVPWSTLLEALPLGAAVFRPEGACLLENGALEAARDLLRQDWRQSESWQTLGLADAAREALATGGPRALEVALESPSGARQWLSFTFSVLPIEGQSYLLVLGADATARVHVEGELRSSEAIHRDLLQRQGIALGLVDDQEVFLLVNPLAEEIFGVPEGQLVGRSILEFLTPEEAERIQAETKLRAQGVDSTYEMQIVRPDGETRHLMVTATRRSRSSEGPLQVIGLFRDTTAQKRLEAERGQLERQVYQTQKLESLGQLAGGVAHDINNVLGAILGMAEVSRMMQPEDSELGRNLDTIIRACNRGGSLVRRLLGFARQTLPVEDALDLNLLVHEQVALLERTTLSRVKLVLDQAPGPLPVRGDASALGHALVNLCVNALDAMAPGGTLTLRTRLAPGSEALLEVIDDGCGMSAELQEKVFDPFFTTKGDRGGTGLGLSLVFSTVKAHRGRIQLESEEGKGTTVSIWLPLEVAPMESGASAGSPAGSTPALRLLVVDDDELIRETLTELLASLGHGAAMVESGEAGLEALETGLQVDAVILDINMPGMGGGGTLERLRARHPELPVLLATGRVDQHALDLVRDHAKVFLLPKPFGIAEVQSAILEALGFGGRS